MSEYSTGDLLVRISGDTGMISNSVLSFIPSVVTTVANFVGAFVIVCYHDPLMALIALAGAPGDSTYVPLSSGKNAAVPAGESEDVQ